MKAFISFLCQATLAKPIQTRGKKQKTKIPIAYAIGIFWSYWPDSNRRPADYESAALPTEPQ